MASARGLNCPHFRKPGNNFRGMRIRNTQLGGKIIGVQLGARPLNGQAHDDAQAQVGESRQLHITCI